MEMVRGLLVDVDVARPGRDEGDAVRDVRSGEWDDAFVDRLRPGLVAPEADKGEKLVLTMPGSISVTRRGWPGSPILRTSMRARVVEHPAELGPGLDGDHGLGVASRQTAAFRPRHGDADRGDG